MLLVVPVSQADKHLIESVKKAFSLLNPGLGHDLLVVGQGKDAPYIEQVQEGLSPYFKSSSNLTIPDNVNLGWPLEGNLLFQRTAYHLGNHYQSIPAFFWFELDCTPIKKNWLSTIESAYYADSEKSVRENRPFGKYMGVRQDTVQTRAGELVPSSEAGQHMVATGVYPTKLAQDVKTLSTITSTRVPFSHSIQWYVIRELNNTPLIQNNWRTRNYKAERNALKSENVSDHAFGLIFNKDVDTESEVVLVHGCKDGSLINELQLSQELKEESPTPQALPEQAFTPEIPVYQAPQLGRKQNVSQFAAPPLPAIPATYRQPIAVPNYSREDVYQAPVGQKPLNSFAEGNSQLGAPAPKPEPRAPRIPDSSPEPNQVSEEVLLNNNPQPVRKKGKRGPGRPKKIKRQITPEDREARAQRMREVAKKRWGNKHAEQPATAEVNG